jgi:hypothetical protein
MIMAAFTDNEKELLRSLVQATQSNTIKWDEYKKMGINCFRCFVGEGQKITIDKYYTRTNSETLECFGSAIFDSADKLITDLNVCDVMDRDFALLKTLHEAVELQYKEEKKKSIGPILSQITGSIQRTMPSH